MFTFPFLTLEEETSATVGAANFATLTFACALGEKAKQNTTAKLIQKAGSFFM